MFKVVRAVDSKTNNEFIEELRQRRYREETDPLQLKALEDAVTNNTTPDYTNWLAAKELIRTELPYSE
jgi:hypothetical protein